MALSTSDCNFLADNGNFIVQDDGGKILIPQQLLVDDVIGFSASSSTRGSYGASVNLVNHVLQFGESLTWTPFRIVLDTIATVFDVSVTPGCFAGSVAWVNGLIHSVEDARGLSGDFVRFNIKSFFARLSKKPINTERYENVSAVIIMTDLLDIYATIPAALRDLTGMGAGTIRAVISGNNILQEMRKVAQVAGSDLFVSRDGIFTVDVWKDAGSAVDVAIPPEAVISATVNHGIEVGPTRITVRGRYVSVTDAGDAVLNGPPNGPDSNDPDEQGPETCTKNGISQAQFRVRLANVFGTPEDHRNAKVTIPIAGFHQIVRTQSLREGGFEVLVNAGGSFVDPQTGMSRFQVTGRRSPLIEWLSANTRFGPLRGNQRELGGRIGFAGWKRTDGGLLVTLPGPTQNDNDKNSDEPELTRVEVTVEDPGLQAEFGVVGEQIDNIYATKTTEMMDMAVRRFQEFRMQRRSWQVETAYLPCLELNQVVTFVTPDTEETITGLLTEIKVTYSPSPLRVKMVLVVEDFFDIGATSYTSSNLFLYPDLNGADAVTDGWLTTGSVFMFGGYAGVNPAATLRQTTDLVSGDSYTVTFDVAEPSSGGALTLAVTGCGSGGVGPVGAGSHSHTFVASCSGPATFTWTGGGNGAFLRFPKLTRTTTA